MVLKCMRFTCPTNRKLIHVWEKTEKSFRIWIKSNKKRVLLSVPELIIVGEGIPTPDDITGYSCDVTSEGNPPNNKPKYQSELIHVYKECQQKWYNLIHVWAATAFTVHLSLKSNNYKGIPLLGGHGECPPQGVDKAPPRGDTDGINNSINTVSTQVFYIKVIQVFCATVSIVWKKTNTNAYTFIFSSVFNNLELNQTNLHIYSQKVK